MSVVRVHIKKLPHLCHICGKGFQTATCVKRHILTHTGERSFACEFTDCFKTYASSDSLNKHLTRHYGEKSYKCAFCNVRFVTQYNMNRHKSTHKTCAVLNAANKVEISESDTVCVRNKKKRKHQCQVCNKRLKRYGHMSCHLKTRTLDTHTQPPLGEVVYQCDVCNKTFATSSNVKRHKKTHDIVTCYVSPERYQTERTTKTTWPHTCGLCNMNYTLLAGLLRHLASSHKFPSKNNRKAVVCTIVEME